MLGSYAEVVEEEDEEIGDEEEDEKEQRKRAIACSDYFINRSFVSRLGTGSFKPTVGVSSLASSVLHRTDEDAYGPYGSYDSDEEKEEEEEKQKQPFGIRHPSTTVAPASPVVQQSRGSGFELQRSESNYTDKHDDDYDETLSDEDGDGEAKDKKLKSGSEGESDDEEEGGGGYDVDNELDNTVKRLALRKKRFDEKRSASLLSSTEAAVLALNSDDSGDLRRKDSSRSLDNNTAIGANSSNRRLGDFSGSSTRVSGITNEKIIRDWNRGFHSFTLGRLDLVFR